MDSTPKPPVEAGERTEEVMQDPADSPDDPNRGSADLADPAS